jgi:hypothetical protein
MTRKHLRLRIFFLMGLLGLSACQTLAEGVPSKLDRPDPKTLNALQVTLAKAMGRKPVLLGPDDLDSSTSLTVLPAPLGPYETRSLATPTVFDIISQDGKCYLKRRDTQKIYVLKGVKCRPL